MNDKIQSFRREIFANGRLDEEDMVKLDDFIWGDDGMTREKGNFLFDIKDTVQRSQRLPAFSVLFVDAISSLLLDDDDSPGEIDESEAKWIRAKIQSKGFRDDLDDKLLKNLREKSINFPTILNFKSRYARWVEEGLYASRFLTILAVAGSFLAAIALFVRGTLDVIKGLMLFFSEAKETIGGHSAEELAANEMLKMFVASVDTYLFAMVLIIFSVGVYELFIAKIDPVERKTVSRPSWLRISSIDDLKTSLGKVILMVLIVSFFEHSLDLEYKNVTDLLQLGIGLLLVAAALYLAHKGNHHEEKSDH